MYELMNADQSKIYYSISSWNVRKESEKTHVNQAILVRGTSCNL